MPNFNFDNVQASDAGGFTPFQAGGYVCRVTSTYEDAERQEVGLVFDVAEGDFAGEFSRPFWQGKPEWRHAVTLDTGEPTGRTKARLQAMTDGNPGFDAFAAYKADRWDMFVGRYIGIVFRDVERVYNGKIYTDQRVSFVITPQKVREGDFKVPDKVPAEGPEADLARAASTLGGTFEEQPAVADADIPF